MRLECFSIATDFANHLASILVRPDGTINKWVIADLKKLVASAGKTKYAPLAKHINKVLSQFQDDPSLIRLLAEPKLPDTHDAGKTLIRTMCNLGEMAPITLSHVNRAIVATLLTPFRQGPFGSCHTSGPLIALQNSSTRKLIEDLQEIISKGYLRPANNQVASFDFYASFAVFPARKAMKLKIPVDICAMPTLHLHQTLARSAY